MKTFIFILLIINQILFINLQGQQFVLDEKSRDYDQIHISLDLTFNFEKAIVNGKEEFTFTPLTKKFTKLILHSKTTEVKKVMFDTLSLPFTSDDDFLYIEMFKELSTKDTITLFIEYTSKPVHGIFFFHPTKELRDLPSQIWTQGQGNNNRYWYPAYDLPDDKVTMETKVTVPSKYSVIGNGRLIAENKLDGNQKSYIWLLDTPHSNYLRSLVIGEFVTIRESVRNVNLEYNIPKAWVGKEHHFFGRTPEMLNFFSDYISPYPYDRYAQTTVHDFLYGGMENVTATTLNKRVLHDENVIPNYSADPLIAHEFAHQWFGDLVTCSDWKHGWLNEGFATYFTDLWFEHSDGKNEFYYRRYQQNIEYMKAFDESDFSDKTNNIKEKIPFELSDRRAYSKGAAILHALRFQLGDDVFQNVIREYVKNYQYKNANTENFKSVAESVSKKKLGKFFDQWVYSGGYPIFKISSLYEPSKKKYIITVEQVQKINNVVPIFEAQIQIEYISAKQKYSKTIFISKREETFEFDAPAYPNYFRFNKNNNIPCKVVFGRNFEEISYQLLNDDDIFGRIEAAQLISSFSKKAVLSLFEAIKTDRFYGVKIAALEALQNIGGEYVFDPIYYAATDRDGRVRESAVKALSIFPAERVNKVLKSIYEKDKNDYVRSAALVSLAKIKDAGAYFYLQRALNVISHQNIIRKGSFEGFAILADPRALPLAKEYINYKHNLGGMYLHESEILNFAEVMAQSNRKEVIDIISAGLANPFFRVRNQAASLLIKIKGVEALPLLKTIYENERRLFVKEQLKKAVQSLTEVND
jgi:aminopeptidase N